jgi:hypothetical protein
VVIKNISTAEKAVVTTNGRHDLETGDVVVLREVDLCFSSVD